MIDAHVVTHGALTLSGLISLAVGMLMLFHNAPAPYHTSVPLVISLTVAIGGFWAFALRRRSPSAGGRSRSDRSVSSATRGSCAIRDSCSSRAALARPQRGRPRPRAGGARPVDRIDGLELTVSGE